MPAREWILTGCIGRPHEHFEAELEREYAELVAYHRGRLVARIRAVLEDWALRFAADDSSPAGDGRAA